MIDFSIEALPSLLEEQTGPCVSIFMPLHRNGKAFHQNPVCLGNLLRVAKGCLTAHEMSESTIHEFVAPIERLIGDPDSWVHSREGTAVFLSPRMFHHYSLPLPVKETVFCANRFYIVPLLPFLQEGRRFCILALSQHMVKLYHATQDTIQEVTLEGVPESLEDFLQLDVTKRQVQFYSGGAGGAALYFGTASEKDTAKTDLLHFFQRVDAGVSEHLRNTRVPLVVACVDYLFPIYREANTYPHLIADAIRGNPEDVSPKELHRSALPLVDPFFREPLKQALEQFQRLYGKGLASTQVEEIFMAARYGRVSALFVDSGAEIWGCLNAEGNLVEVHPEHAPGDEELINYTVVQTLQHKGMAYSVEPHLVPERASMAAVFRY